METKKLKNRTELLVYILGVLAILVGINYLGNRWFKRMDMTAGKEYSVSKATKNVLKQLDDIINIKVYFSKNLPPNLHQTITDVKDILSEYQAYAGKNLKITWIDPAEDQAAKDQARALGIPEVQMQTFEKDKAQVINGYLGLGVLYEDKKEAIPVVQNLQNLEYDLTLAIMKVSRKSTPKVGVVKTDTMPFIPPQMRAQMNVQDQTEEKYSQIFENLRQNYEVSTVDISEGNPIDSTIKTIIVPGGYSFTDRKLFEIDQFFMKGGNLIVLTDPVKVSFEYGVNGTAQESKMYDLLEHYGVRINKDLVLDASCGQVTIPQKFGPFSMNVAVPYPYFVRIGPEGINKSNPAVAPLSEIILPWTSSLSLLVNPDTAKKTGTQPAQPVIGTVLLSSSKKSWTATGYFNLNPQQQWAPPAANQTKEHTIMACLTGDFKSFFAGKNVPPVKDTAKDSLSKINVSANPADQNRTIVPANKKGNLVVVGDAEFVSSQNATPGNMALLMNLVDWLSLDQNLITIRTRAIKDRTIEKDLLKEGSAKPNIIRLANIITMPVLLIAFGLIIFVRRREKIAPASATSVPSTTANPEEKK